MVQIISQNYSACEMPSGQNTTEIFYKTKMLIELSKGFSMLQFICTITSVQCFKLPLTAINAQTFLLATLQ